MRLLAIVCLLVLSGCGQECHRGELDGSYLVESSERAGGTCGPQSDIVVQMSNGQQVAGGGCMVQFERFSDDACDVDRSIVCVDTAQGTTGTGAGHIAQEPGGASATGILTIELEDSSSGDQLCMSTYDVTYTRQ